MQFFFFFFLMFQLKFLCGNNESYVETVLPIPHHGFEGSLYGQTWSSGEMLSENMRGFKGEIRSSLIPVRCE